MITGSGSDGGTLEAKGGRPALRPAATRPCRLQQAGGAAERPALRRSCAQQNARSFCMGARARTEEQQPSLSLAAVRTPEERQQKSSCSCWPA